MKNSHPLEKGLSKNAKTKRHWNLEEETRLI